MDDISLLLHGGHDVTIHFCRFENTKCHCDAKNEFAAILVLLTMRFLTLNRDCHVCDEEVSNADVEFCLNIDLSVEEVGSVP